jgi:DNA-binding CsgD family transcriptional regulator
LEPAWQALGKQEGRLAFEEGQAMTFEEALTYALQDPPLKGAQDTRGVTQEAIEANATRLSARELEVLKLVAEGLTDSQVAQRLYLSPRTVGHHLRRAYRKLGVSSRTAALREASGRGLI